MNKHFQVGMDEKGDFPYRGIVTDMLFMYMHSGMPNSSFCRCPISHCDNLVEGIWAQI